MSFRLRIGQLASAAGVSTDTVRYYERRRVIPRPVRTGAGYRVYSDQDVERLHFIKQAQEIGLSLDEIRDLLGNEGRAGECKRMRDLLKVKLVELDQRFNSLRDFRRTLARHLSACEDELRKRGTAAKCPVIVQIAEGRSQRHGKR